MGRGSVRLRDGSSAEGARGAPKPRLATDGRLVAGRRGVEERRRHPDSATAEPAVGTPAHLLRVATLLSDSSLSRARAMADAAGMPSGEMRSGEGNLLDSSTSSFWVVVRTNPPPLLRVFEFLV